MNKSSRIFVAGHRGLIGSAFMRFFQKNGYSQIFTCSRAELDLSNRNAVFDFFHRTRPEYVIFAAGKVGGIVENKTYPTIFLQQNLEIQLNVFAAAQEFAVQRFIFFGSSCMYPRECCQPMKEDLLLTGKPEQTSMAYAMAKLTGVQMCLAYNAQYGVNRFLPVIPNSVYGCNDNFDPVSGHVLSALINRFHEAKKNGFTEVTLWGSGKPRREFLFADDLVEACQILLENNSLDTTLPINIGPGEDISIQELAKIVAETVGYEGKIFWDTTKPDGALRKLLDSHKIKSLGWEPRTSLEQGLKETYTWYLHHSAHAVPGTECLGSSLQEVPTSERKM